MRIVNKDRQSKSEDKRISARLIRRLPLNDPQPPQQTQPARPECMSGVRSAN
jgi:hypothetical protein